MRYFKMIDGNYIIAIGTGEGNIEITKAEYDTIMEVIKNKPYKDGKEYLLRIDLTWEEIDIPEEE